LICFSQDGYLEGELLDGRKGLVPSNLIERLAGEDLLEFHQSCVVGVQEEDIWSTMVPRDRFYKAPFRPKIFVVSMSNFNFC
jgi:RIMS-binding protein 2